MRHLIALVAASAFLLQSDIVPAQVGEFPFVLTREEQVLGVVQAGVASFKGIPYASAPVGSLRWRPPQPAPESSTIRTAYEYGPACQQPSMPGLGACPNSRCSNPRDSDSTFGYEQVFSSLEYRSNAAAAAERAGLRTERPCLAIYR